MPPSNFTYDLPSDAPSAILRENSVESGYIWHTTGNGKTLTSFNASTLRDTLLPKVLSGEITFRSNLNEIAT